MAEIGIGVVGCCGRMGINLLHQISARAGCFIAGGSERPGHDAIGQDIGEFAGLGSVGKAIMDDPRDLFQVADVVLDFTTPSATVAHASLAAENGTPLVAGTTGLEPDDQAAIVVASQNVAVLQAANMSVGVNLLERLTQQAASMLDEDFDIEIVEIHHRHKVDAPSGTALMLGRAAAAGRGVDHDSVADRGRDGITGERKRGDIGYASLRGGNVAGEHSVIFAADNERIELVHKATDRAIFARGAVQAGCWLHGKPAGIYDMKDVLGI
jgi:4-hydroxy-tetrahydrodipicolinate reductase